MQKQIIILGGGFGGLAAANELKANLPDAKVTIIDKNDYFMMGLVKLWIIKGTRQFETSKRPLKSVAKRGIDFVNEKAVAVDTNQKKVRTETREFYYDYLIIAVGAEIAPEKIPGLSENAMILYDLGHVTQIRQKILQIKSGKIAFAITSMPYKCPPAPFEAALIISTMLKELKTRDSISIDFYSLAPITLPAAGPEVSKQILEILESEKIKFHGSRKIIAVEQNLIKFEDGSTEKFDLLIAVPPHKAPKIVYDSNFAQEGQFISVKRDCKTQFENVYAVGDVMTMMVTDKLAVPKAGIFAESQGMAVAHDIIAQIKKTQSDLVFDGKGGCFIEMGSTAGYIYVDMFAQPSPITRLDKPAEEHMLEKEQFEKERLARWL